MFKKLKEWFGIKPSTPSTPQKLPDVSPPNEVYLGDPVCSSVLAEPSATQKNKHGHKFNHAVEDGYGVCKCGARENTEAATKRCPLAGKARKRKPRKPKAKTSE